MNTTDDNTPNPTTTIRLIKGDEIYCAAGEHSEDLLAHICKGAVLFRKEELPYVMKIAKAHGWSVVV